MRLDLQSLRYLTELKFQGSQMKMAAICRRETELRCELQRLEALARKTQAQPMEQEEMRAIGADMIWLRWVGQAQRKLNIELAQVLARKEALNAEHRKAHGKMMVSQALVETELQEITTKQRKASLDAAIESSLPERSANSQ